MSAPVWLCTFLGLLAVIVMITVAGLGNGSWSPLPLSQPWRRRMIRHKRRLRLASAMGWPLAWTGAMIWVTPLPEQRLMALLVGLFLGVVVAAYGDVLIRRTLGFWASDHETLPRPGWLPGRGMTVRSQERCAIVIHSEWFELSRGARPSYALARATRWVRNVLALLLVALVAAIRLAQPLGHEDDWILPLSGAIFVSVASLILVVLAQRRRRRSEDRRAEHLERVQLLTLLEEHGWKEVARTTRDLRARFPGLGVLPPRTELHRVLHRIEGVANGYSFWYVSEEGAARNIRQKVMEDKARCLTLMPIPGQRALLPRMSVAGRETRYLVEQRVNHSLELEEFNRRFHVESEQAQTTTAILTPRMMEHIDRELPDGATLTVVGDAVSLRLPEHLRPWRLEHQLNFLAGFLDLLPTYLRKEVRIAAPQAAAGGMSDAARE